jgi:DNA uptake protein ComE-like DNA-binding protein
MKCRRVFLVLACAGVCAFAKNPFATASQSPQPAAHSSFASAEARVDINTASLDQLMKVPGLPRTWAARIIRYRPYRAKNELVDRGVVTPQVYDRIKDYIIAHREKQ